MELDGLILFMYSLAMLAFSAPSYLRDFTDTATDPQQADIALQNLANDLHEAATEPDSFSIGFLYPEDRNSRSMRIQRRQQFFEACFHQAAKCSNPALRALLFDSIARYTGNPAIRHHSAMQNIHRAAARFLLKENACNEDPRYAETLDGLHAGAIDILCGPEADILSKMECGFAQPVVMMIVARDVTERAGAHMDTVYHVQGAQDFTPCQN